MNLKIKHLCHVPAISVLLLAGLLTRKREISLLFLLVISGRHYAPGACINVAIFIKMSFPLLDIKVFIDPLISYVPIGSPILSDMRLNNNTCRLIEL